MKVINETPEEIVLSRPSKIRTALGIILVVVGGGLFLVTAIGFSNDVILSIIAFSVFGIGLFVIFLNTHVTVHIDKNARVVHHHKKSIAGRQTHSEHFAVDDACRVEIRPSNKKNSPAQVFIVFSDGSEIRIDHAHKPKAGAEGDESAASTAERVAGFLNISLHDLTRPKS